MSANPQVTILMATYNGARFLDEQIKSIQAQTFTNWELIIRDDNSSDETLAIINSFITADSRIKLITNGTLHGSACINFSNLFDWVYTSGDKNYIMFTDQDDIWMEHKVERSLNFIKQQENIYPNMPILGYSRFKYMSVSGDPIAQELQFPLELRLSTLLMENYAWGCTMIMNQQLVKQIRKIPVNVVNHDYWVAMVAAAFGKAVLLDEPLLYYRQHDVNVSGTYENSSTKNRFARYFSNLDTMVKPLYMNFLTVKEFFNSYAGELSKANLKMLEDFIKGYSNSTIGLLSAIFRHHIWKVNFGKNIMMLYSLSFLRPKVYNMYLANVKKD